MLLVGTADGLLDLDLDGTEVRRTLPGADVISVSDDWAIADGWVMALDSGRAVALPDGLVPRCVLSVNGGRALVGTSGAHVLAVGGPDDPTRDVLFDAVPARAGWSTPWGAPADTRSLAVGPDGPYAGVHVGGVWRRTPVGWIEVVPAEAPVPRATEFLAARRSNAGGGAPGRRPARWPHHDARPRPSV